MREVCGYAGSPRGVRATPLQRGEAEATLCMHDVSVMVMCGAVRRFAGRLPSTRRVLLRPSLRFPPILP